MRLFYAFSTENSDLGERAKITKKDFVITVPTGSTVTEIAPEELTNVSVYGISLIYNEQAYSSKPIPFINANGKIGCILPAKATQTTGIYVRVIYAEP